MGAGSKRIRRERIDELVYIRAIAALGILIIHATGGFVVYSDFNSRAMQLGIFLNQFFRFGSPIFMMISGLVIFYNYRSREGFDLERFLRKKIRFILVPYLIWSLIYFFYNVSRFKLDWTMGELINKLLLGGAYSHLYFIFLIFQFYLLVPLLLRFIPKQMEERPFKVVGISFILQFLVLIYGYYWKNDFNLTFLKTFNQLYWKTFLAWQYYFILGGTIGVHYSKIRDFIEEHIGKLLVIFLLMTVFYVGQVYLDVYSRGNLDKYDRFGSIRPQTMFFATATMPVLIYISRRLVGSYKLIENFGMYSFGVYFTHPLVLSEIKKYLFRNTARFGYGRLSSLVLITVLAIVFTYGFVALIASLPIRKLLIGNIPRYKFSLFGKEE